MWPSTWLPFLYPPPASVYVAAMSAVSLMSMANAGLAELRGNHMAYSKFWHVVAAGAGGGKQQQRGGGGGALLKSRDGMLVAYAPALVAAAASFAVPGAVDGARAQILSAALAVHFLKRVLEVLFVHRYSGSMPLDTAVTIGTSYLLSTVTMIYTQHLSRGLPDPPVDLLYPGVAVFAVGIAGNFYHHYLLSRLRADDGGGDKGYKIPRGGLFELVTCPHYLFEITGFFGFAMIGQTVYALAVATGTAAYLAGRSCATRRWYESKFKEFPARIKALVPFVL
ncbi:very-long-chain enoyl-CoA reductase-like [Panicum miliaceum]|uniref:Very-long-chain enoyl-CoA reductase-like n=1 Tax=Panicum miliaceum TaxID=4540 RepID=A0A3L6T844_PANMI|nr:very-long-chain enoyl-CoA reductase-like [Panicum miliaceum]